MDLRHLRYFVAVVDTGSISRAAQRLFIRQPTLSAHIRGLEEELGVELFIRASRGVVPTDAGRQLFTRAKQVISDVEKLPHVVKQPSGRQEDAMPIAFAPSLLGFLLPELVKRMERHSVSVHPLELSGGAQVTALMDGDVAYGFLRQSSVRPDIRAVCDMEDPWVAAVHESTWDADPSRRVTLKSFSQHPIIIANEGHSTAGKDGVAQLCEAAGFKPAEWIESTSLHGALSMAAAKAGVAIVPASAVLLKVAEPLRFALLREQSVRSRIVFARSGKPEQDHSLMASIAQETFVQLSSTVRARLRGQESRSAS